MTGLPATRDAATYDGPAKAAIVLLALPQEAAARLLEKLSEEEIRTVSTAMAALGPIAPAAVERICGELLSAGDGPLVGSSRSAERLLKATLASRGELVDAIVQELRGPADDAVWSQLSAIRPQRLAAYLGSEHPQVAALMLRRLDPAQAASVVPLLPDGLLGEALARMVRLEQVRPEVLEDIERALRDELLGGEEQGQDPCSLLADIVGRLDQAAEQRVLGALARAAPEQAERVRGLQVSFADLALLKAEAIQALLRECDKGQLVLALKIADEAQRQAFYAGMSERQVKMLKDELAQMAPVRRAEAEAAQRALTATAKAMAAKGELVLRPGAEPDDLV